MAAVVAPVVAALALLGLWQVLVWLEVRPVWVLPGPADVWTSLTVDLGWREAFSTVWTSLSRGALGFLAPRFFSAGLIAAGFTTLISVALTMSYFCVDMARRDWHFSADNRFFRGVFAAWIAIPPQPVPISSRWFSGPSRSRSQIRSSFATCACSRLAAASGK